jgi:hypothetical protein
MRGDVNHALIVFIAEERKSPMTNLRRLFTILAVTNLLAMAAFAQADDPVVFIRQAAAEALAGCGLKIPVEIRA